MTPKKRRRKGPVEAYIGFLRGLAAGDMGPVERSRMIAGNFFNRYWVGALFIAALAMETRAVE